MTDNILLSVCTALTVMLTIIGCGHKQVAFIGHRGASHIAPENTVASVKLAWELGADGAEIDIYLTSDSRIVANHDDTTKRTGGIDYTVIDTDSEILRMLDVGSWKSQRYKGEKIPFLEEIIATVPDDRILVIEIKDSRPEILSPLKKIVNTSGKKGSFVFIAFDYEIICGAKEAMPEIPAYWLSGSRKDENTGKVLPYSAELIEKTKAGGLDGLNLHHGGVTAEFAKKVRKAGLGLYVWTVNDPETARRMVEYGVDAITTDRPSWLKEQITK
ncbi:MAG: glycerophosphodiester phosphodiesterase [Candidatus Latescibacteria bacterium]|nr:glycerophosphodiester phosphodiesterase [Candidatus Latescibacterota bacterium]